MGVAFLADQSKKSQYKASAMKQGTQLSTQLWSELTGEETSTSNAPSTGGGGSTNPTPNPSTGDDDNGGDSPEI